MYGCIRDFITAISRSSFLWSAGSRRDLSMILIATYGEGKHSLTIDRSFRSCRPFTFWWVSQCVANLTTAKLPLPIVRSRKYLPIFICRCCWNGCWCCCEYVDVRSRCERGDPSVLRKLVEVMVDVRECDAEDTGEADGDETGEAVVERTDGTDDNGGSLNIWNEARDAKPTRHSSWHAICLLCQHVIMQRTLLWHDECRNEEVEKRLHVSFRKRKEERKKEKNSKINLVH